MAALRRRHSRSRGRAVPKQLASALPNWRVRLTSARPGPVQQQWAQGGLWYAHTHMFILYLFVRDPGATLCGRMLCSESYLSPFGHGT
jgi:hypothetical protein